MKKLCFILTFICIFNSAKAQLSFEAKIMINKFEEVEKIENVDTKISINSDTTEIEIKFKNAKLIEPLGELSHRHINEGYQMDVYGQKKGSWVILHFRDGALFSAVFHTETRVLEFE